MFYCIYAYCIVYMPINIMFLLYFMRNMRVFKACSTYMLAQFIFHIFRNRNTFRDVINVFISTNVSIWNTPAGHINNLMSIYRIVISLKNIVKYKNLRTVIKKILRIRTTIIIQCYDNNILHVFTQSRFC